MLNNTIITASDSNYLWGVFLLIASMRRNNMDEPVLVLGQNYSPRDCRILQQFPDVIIHAAAPTARTLACSKPEAMLLADTDYLTWVDCDGFFSGNVSAFLAPRREDEIHIRKRSPEENAVAFAKHLFDGDGRTIPPEIIAAWRQDVPDAASKPAIMQCCSDCFLSVHRSQRHLLELWRDQMDKVLPLGNRGVVNNALRYYHQLDESVLNSLLCLRPDAPQVCERYMMDKPPAALYIHFVCHPKPWVHWTNYSFRHFDSYLQVVDYVLDSGLELPTEPPMSLTRSNKMWCRILLPFFYGKHKIQRAFRKIIS